ncbi:Protein of unknown function [Dyadobacter soli]|uniref:DUF2809 domain-containing protein n=1 Tax=Dyadobacter soli TaxID=659014 RepID=A0A1G7NJ36_9BACT|nr:DUF2809 domain-containing protein [Dyadobacter soli]SDF74084.1 Protein of unknown function [Dyadobacter soli]
MLKTNYLIAALVIFITEVWIAMYVHDDFVRPWGGDVLVVVLLYCFVRGISRLNVLSAALSVLLFSWFIEALQYLQIVRILGLEGNAVARTIIGTTFSWSDIVAYTLGIVLVVGVEIGRVKKHAL